MNIYVLVGTNPLPCYLSALYLLDHYVDQDSPDLEQEYQKHPVFLVCSKENIGKRQSKTTDVADRIKDALEKERDGVAVKLRMMSDINNGDAISDFVEELRLEGDTHLNYTGGTKAMATLTYYHMQCELGCTLKSSYLDSRIHRMETDMGSPCKKDLRLRYGLSINDLARLHGIEDIRANVKSDFDAAAKIMNELFDKHLGGCQHPFFELFIRCGACDSGKERDRAKADFRDTPFGKYLNPKSDSDVSHEAAIQSARDLGLYEAIKAMKDPAILEKEVGKDKRRKIFEFLDGKWFEHYVVEKLRAACSQEDKIDIYFDVSWGDDARFQLDIVIIYGYQLSVISVTTSHDKGVVKQKAFEAIHRARQMGGDETKMVIMSFLNNDNRENLDEELELYKGSTFPYYRIYGEKDLKDKDIYKDIIKFIKK